MGTNWEVMITNISNIYAYVGYIKYSPAGAYASIGNFGYFNWQYIFRETA
jgi:hypothetical protein